LTVRADLQGPTFFSSGDAASDKYDHIANLTGSNFNDQLIGDVNANVITGGTGNDTLEGMGGADVLIGGVDKININNPGDNNNTASYEHWANLYGVGITASLTNSTSNTGDAGGDTYYNIQNLTGTSYGDTLIGDAYKNILSGGGGNDRLEGMGGSDRLDGGIGNDTASYSQSQIDITASLTDVTTLNKSYTTTLVISGDAIGDIYVNQSIENLLGSDSNDTLVGDFHNNILTGGVGNDTLEGLGGADALIGGDGIDTVSFDHAAIAVVASLTTSFRNGATVAQEGDAGDISLLTAGDTYSGIENMVGSHLNDTLIGDSGDNSIYGGAGDDKLEGMGGAHDTLYGGSGSNTASYAHAGAVSGSSGVTALLLTPLDSTGNTGDAAGDVYYDISNLEGSDFNDTLQGNDSANTLVGMAGDDTLEGLAGADILIGNDLPNDGPYDLNNTASYKNAKETTTGSGVGVTASLDADYQNSGIDAEGDTYHNILNLLGSGYNDKLIGDGGSNRLDGGAGSDLLIGGAGSDQLVGGDSAAELPPPNSDIGHDITQTGSGSTLSGGDTASYETAVIVSGTGVVASLTTKFAYGATVYQQGDASGDTFVGIENLTGSANNDTLIGNGGFNLLNGGAGNDTLEGMSGADYLKGGGGSDTASYAHAGYASTDLTHTIGITASLTPADSNFRVTFTSGSQLTVSGDAQGDCYDGIQNLLGSDYNDVLIGNDSDNILFGGKGNDTLEGLGGNDRYFGGDGNFSGDDGNDTVSFAHSSGSVAASLDDTLKYNSIENLEGSAFNDTLSGNGLVNTLWGGAGDDVLEGKGGADILIGGVNKDDINPNDHNNTASYASSTAGIVVSLIPASASTPSVNTGDAAGDTYFNIRNLLGSSSNDTLIGDNKANTLSGGGGDDLLEGKEGADRLDGGTNLTGGDTASYAQAAMSIITSLTDVATLVQDSLNWTTLTFSGDSDSKDDTYVNVENLLGSDHNDILIGDSVNSVTGATGVNTITGGLGDDTMEGLGGGDHLYGGDGTDTVSYDHATGYIISSLTTSFSQGAPVVQAGDAGDASHVTAGDTYSSIENMIGSRFNDTLIGDGGVNVINGGFGDDKLEGMGDGDKLIGGGHDIKGDTASYAHAGPVSSSIGVTASLLNTVLTAGDIRNPVTLANGGDAYGDTYLHISNLEGSAFDDRLQGDDGKNTLTGMVGDDTLEGLGEADKLEGDAGSNTASYAHSSQGVTASLANSGNNSVGTDAAGDMYYHIQNLLGSDFNDILIGDSTNENAVTHALGVNTLAGGLGDDTLEGLGGADALYGGEDTQDRTITIGANLDLNRGDTASYANYAGTAGVTASLIDLGLSVTQSGDAAGDTFYDIENLTGSNYGDTLIGDGSNNILRGGGGNDILEGRGGADLLIGGGDSGTIDTASYAHAVRSGVPITNLITNEVTYVGLTASLTDVSTLNNSNTTTLAVSGDAVGDAYVGIQNLLGSDYNDILVGNSGVNTLSGGMGDDTLEGLAGADYMVGSLGSDTVSYDHAGAAVVSSLTTSFTQGIAPDTTHVAVAGDAAGDTYSSIENMLGSYFADTLIGDSGDNIIHGGADNDTLEGMGGADALYGDAGVDTASYAHATSLVKASLTADQIIGEGMAYGDTFFGIENLEGSNFNDILIGNNKDILNGITGNNTLLGGAGDDTLEGFGGLDTLNGGSGTNTVSYEHSLSPSILTGYVDATNTSVGVTASLTTNIGSYNNAPGTTVGAAADNEQIFVSNTIQNLIGSGYADTLTGNASANTLTGGDGNDTLSGLAGVDMLYAGYGDDLLIDDGAGSPILKGEAGDDRIIIKGATPDWQTDSVDGGLGVDTLAWQVSGPGYIQTDMNARTFYNSSTGWYLSYAGIENISTLGSSAYMNYLYPDNNNNILTGNISTANGDLLHYVNASSAVIITLTDVKTYIDPLSGTITSYTDGSGFHTGSGVGLETGSVTGGSGNDTLYGIEHIRYASNYNDILIGNSLNNYLGGGQGADYIDGGDGFDYAYYYDGPSGGNYGGGGTVSLMSADKNATLGIVFTGQAAGDTLVNIEGIQGSQYVDIFYGNNGINNFISAGGADTLEGLAGADYFDGANTATVSYDHAGLVVPNGWETSVTATAGEPTRGLTAALIIGYTGTGATGNYYDFATGSNNGWGTGTDRINQTGDAAFDRFYNVLSLTGSTLDDKLIGNTGANIIKGGSGNDTLEGLAGADNLNGGAGSDWASYQHAASSGGKGVTVYLDETVVNAGIDALGDTYTSIENLRGSAYDDTLFGDGNANILIGAGGSNTLDGGGGLNTVSYAESPDFIEVTTSGSNFSVEHGAVTDTLVNIQTIIGTTSADSFIGSVGNDWFDPGGGTSGAADEIDGKAGNDTVSFASTNSTVNITLSDSADTEAGAIAGYFNSNMDIKNIENIVGGSGGDSITGNSSNNTIDGGLGNDILSGGVTGAHGIDAVTYANSNSAVIVDLSNGTAAGGLGSDTLTNFNNIIGSAYNDTLTGDSGDNIITGGTGNNLFNGGGGGSDTFIGGLGTDTVSYTAHYNGVVESLGSTNFTSIENMIGSVGDDTLTGSTSANTIDGGAGNDTLDGGGGVGIDTVSYTSHASFGASHGITVDLGNSRAGYDADFNNAVSDAEREDILRSCKIIT